MLNETFEDFGGGIGGFYAKQRREHGCLSPSPPFYHAAGALKAKAK